MEVRAVKFSQEQLHELLPIGVYGMLSEDSHVIAAIEDNTVHSIALAQEKGEDEFIVLYLSLVVSEDLSDIKPLMDYIEKVCREASLKLTIRLSGDDDYMMQMHDLLEERGYYKAFDNGHHLEYNLKSVKDTLFYSKIDQLHSIMTKVKCYNELDIQLLNQFHDKIKKTRIVSEQYMPDLVFAQYYVSDGVIKGFMDFKEVDEGVILLTDSYVEADVKDKYVAPAMIATALKITNSFFAEDSALILQTFQANMYKGITACFGEAAVDNPIREYQLRR